MDQPTAKLCHLSAIKPSRLAPSRARSHPLSSCYQLSMMHGRLIAQEHLEPSDAGALEAQKLHQDKPLNTRDLHLISGTLHYEHSISNTSHDSMAETASHEQLKLYQNICEYTEAPGTWSRPAHVHNSLLMVTTLVWQSFSALLGSFTRS